MADGWGVSSVQSRGADTWPRPLGPFAEAEWEALPAQGSDSWLPSSDVAFILQNPVLVKDEKEESNITSLCGVFQMTSSCASHPLSPYPSAEGGQERHLERTNTKAGDLRSPTHLSVLQTRRGSAFQQI